MTFYANFIFAKGHNFFSFLPYTYVIKNYFEGGFCNETF